MFFLTTLIDIKKRGNYYGYLPVSTHWHNYCHGHPDDWTAWFWAPRSLQSAQILQVVCLVFCHQLRHLPGNTLHFRTSLHGSLWGLAMVALATDYQQHSEPVCLRTASSQRTGGGLRGEPGGTTLKAERPCPTAGQCLARSHCSG